MKSPADSFYALQAIGIDNKPLSMEGFRGKKILLVNTASDCGYTNQYEDLEKLYRQFEGKLVVLGFPANDFKAQETGSNEAIATFCKVNFGVSFPLMQKSQVIKGAAQNPIFNWLSDAQKNGWNHQAPVWNFCKYLINEQGLLTHYFDPAVAPLSNEITSLID